MKISIAPPKYMMPATPEAIVLLAKGTLKVQEIVSLYSYVAKNVLEEVVEHKHMVENVTINFILCGNEIQIKSANYEKPNRYDNFYKLSLHFLSRLIERGFDLIVLVAIYQYVLQTDIGNGQEIEMDCTHTSACFVKYDNCIKLLTGWPGSRKAS